MTVAKKRNKARTICSSFVFLNKWIILRMRQVVVAEGSAILNWLNLSCFKTLVIYWKLFVQKNPICLAVIFAMLSWVFISINDTVIKLLSDTYPLHQMVFIRSVIGIFFSLFLGIITYPIYDIISYFIFILTIHYSYQLKFILKNLWINRYYLYYS